MKKHLHLILPVLMVLTASKAFSQITGSGTLNYVPKFTGTTSIGNSSLFELNGNVGIGTTNPVTSLHIEGNSPIITFKATNLGSGVRFNAINQTGDLFRFQKDGITQMVINSASNVGIGTTSPNAKLDVVGTVDVGGNQATGQLSITAAAVPIGLYETDTDTHWRIPLDGSDLRFDVSTSGGASFTTYKTPLHLDVNGSVGIGTINPSKQLTISSGADVYFRLEKPNYSDFFDLSIQTHSAVLNYTAGTAENSDLHFQTNNIGRMLIDDSGNIGIGTTSPIERLDIASGLVRISKANSQDDNSPGIICHSNDDFSYDGLYLNHYGFGFHRPEIYDGAETGAYVSGFYGLDLFTGGLNRLSILRNGNVGIGTTTPTEKLDVNGTVKATAFVGDGSGLTGISGGLWTANGNDIYYNTGKVGIGTTDPQANLHIKNSEYYMAGNLAGVNNNSMSFRIGGNETDDILVIGDMGNALKCGGHSCGHSVGVQAMNRVTNDSISLLFNPFGGNVGIGTLSPQSTLTVNGTIRATEIIVTSAWADFVFDDDYQLPSLNEVEKFISENKHLPEIPTAKEVMEDGVKVGVMNAKLLQKIEELTLYVIEQNKRIEQLERENKGLKN